ncbi:putative membrane protein [Streptococcus pneumoniae 2072047]|nr:putative membrane protein [Streptococcus pneumoniae 2072047]
MVQKPLGCFFFCYQITISPNHIKGQACLVFAITRSSRITVGSFFPILINIILIEFGLSFITSKTTVMIANGETCLLHGFDEFDQLCLGCWIFPWIIVFRQWIVFVGYDDFIVFPLNAVVITFIDHFCFLLGSSLRLTTDCSISFGCLFCLSFSIFIFVFLVNKLLDSRLAKLSRLGIFSSFLLLYF